MEVKKIQIKIIDRTESWQTRSYLIPIFNGLRVTVRHFFQNLFGKRKTVTINYPEVQRPVSERWRGRHRLTRRPDGFIQCVACYLCETVCPANCIYIEAAEHPDKSIEKYPRVFDIDELRCVFCGLCVEACPKDAIKMDSGIIGMAFNQREKFDFTRNLLLDELPKSAAELKYPKTPLPKDDQQALPNSVGVVFEAQNK